MAKRTDLSGKKFGRLTVIWPSARTLKDTLYFCVCDCGTMRQVWQGNMTRKSSRRTYSCGCLAKTKFVTHGACVGGKTKEYRAYAAAKQRCTNPKRDSYPWYGGANPPVLFKFDSFTEWLAELGMAPGRGYTPDRINPWGHYEKGNLHWATREEQARNKRRFVTCP